MPARRVDRREIRLVARGRDLNGFRRGLRVGQILRGRVVEVLGSGRIIISLRGHHLMAETRGIATGRGQTMELLVQEVSRKIKLKLATAGTFSPTAGKAVSNLTLSRLLGELRRLEELVFDQIEDRREFQPLKKSLEQVRQGARKGPVFLARSKENNYATLVPGEIVTQIGGYPAVLRVSNANDSDEELRQDDGITSGAVVPWFELSMETETFGPVSLLVYREGMHLRFDCFVLNDVVQFFADAWHGLGKRCGELGYVPVEMLFRGLNEDLPDVLNVMDRYLEEDVNFRV